MILRAFGRLHGGLHLFCLFTPEVDYTSKRTETSGGTEWVNEFVGGFGKLFFFDGISMEGGYVCTFGGGEVG